MELTQNLKNAQTIANSNLSDWYVGFLEGLEYEILGFTDKMITEHNDNVNDLAEVIAKYSNRIIDDAVSDPNFAPKPYDYADWFIGRLLEIGFMWEDDQKPHFKLFCRDICITISPYPNVVIVGRRIKSFVREIYCQHGIPVNEDEFNDFFNKIKSVI